MTKLTRFDNEGLPLRFDDYPEHEQRLMMLIGGIKGNYKTDYIGMEKALSVRLTSLTYPKVKALSTLSGNSLNLVINDLIEVAYGVIIDKADKESAETLLNTEHSSRHEWTEELKKVEK